MCWGDDKSRFSGWALVNNYVSRVFLPAEVAGSRYVSWSEAATLHDNEPPSSGYVTWGEVTAWKSSGSGPQEISVSYYPDELTVKRLTRACAELVGRGALWCSATQSLRIQQVMNVWAASGQLGAWRSGSVSIAAPAYADSAMLSAPWQLDGFLGKFGLEAWAVDPHQPLPDMEV